MTSPSKFLAQAGEPGNPDGVVDYESKLIALNAIRQTRQAVDRRGAPADSVVSADFPLALLDGANPGVDLGVRGVARLVALAGRSTADHRQDDGQRCRPLRGVKPDPKFGDWVLVELPFPGEQGRSQPVA